MSNTLTIGNREIGGNNPIYIIGEIGLNHNGDIDIAKQLIDVAKESGCDAVKFQKRTPELCVPMDQREIQRETPWGIMSYMDYRYEVEFGEDEYAQIDEHAKRAGIHWFTSCWDVKSVAFTESFSPVCYKIASATITNDELMACHAATGRPIIISTGMSTMEEIDQAMSHFPIDRLAVLHTTSTYPCKAKEVNLRMIHTLQKKFSCPVGYSGHEAGLQISLAAAALGAAVIERHITLDRTMWGSDQAASVEPAGLTRLVRDIRVIEQAMGDGIKRVVDSEVPIRKKLRGN